MLVTQQDMEAVTLVGTVKANKTYCVKVTSPLLDTHSD